MIEADPNNIGARERELLDCFSCGTAKAVRAFSRGRTAALARRVIFKLQRLPASRTFGGHYRFRTLWDEYCHEKAIGPSDPLTVQGFDAVVDPTIVAAVSEVSMAELALLSLAAAWEYDHDGYPAREDARLWHDGVCDLVKNDLDCLAVDRDMSRFNSRANSGW